jgi:hypothetical protein
VRDLWQREDDLVVFAASEFYCERIWRTSFFARSGCVIRYAATVTTVLP